MICKTPHSFTHSWFSNLMIFLHAPVVSCVQDLCAIISHCLSDPSIFKSLHFTYTLLQLWYWLHPVLFTSFQMVSLLWAILLLRVFFALHKIYFNEYIIISSTDLLSFKTQCHLQIVILIEQTRCLYS
jgi:hypothetical protein